VSVLGGTPVLYVYAVVDIVPAALGLGLDEVPLRAVTAGRVAAVVGEHLRPPEVGDDQLYLHEALIGRLTANATVLPLRFGTTAAGEQELRGWLHAHEGELLALMDAVRGAIELSVRADLSVESRDDRRIHRPLARLARRSILFPAGPGSGRMRAAYLVGSERVEDFAAETDRLSRELGVEISCTGPWPPYSFASEIGR
jgi:hypothetical protein